MAARRRPAQDPGPPSPVGQHPLAGEHVRADRRRRRGDAARLRVRRVGPLLRRQAVRRPFARRVARRGGTQARLDRRPQPLPRRPPGRDPVAPARTQRRGLDLRELRRYRRAPVGLRAAVPAGRSDPGRPRHRRRRARDLARLVVRCLPHARAHVVGARAGRRRGWHARRVHRRQPAGRRAVAAAHRCPDLPQPDAHRFDRGRGAAPDGLRARTVADRAHRGAAGDPRDARRLRRVGAHGRGRLPPPGGRARAGQRGARSALGGDRPVPHDDDGAGDRPDRGPPHQPAARTAAARVVIDPPPGWTVTPERAEGTVEPGAEGVFAFELGLPDETAPGRHVITADITFAGRHWGQLAEGWIDVIQEATP